LARSRLAPATKPVLHAIAMQIAARVMPNTDELAGDRDLALPRGFAPLALFASLDDPANSEAFFCSAQELDARLFELLKSSPACDVDQGFHRQVLLK
jgi:hypothetical protein